MIAASAFCRRWTRWRSVTRAKPAQVALAWLMARPSITAPIASATSVEQLNELAQATKLELDRESMEKLNKASAYDEPAERIA